MALLPKHVTSAGAHLAAQRLDNTALKKRHSGSDTVSDLTGLVIDPQTSHAYKSVFGHYANGPVSDLSIFCVIMWTLKLFNKL